jgi:outer membrane protein assembly factor BamA
VRRAHRPSTVAVAIAVLAAATLCLAVHRAAAEPAVVLIPPTQQPPLPPQVPALQPPQDLSVLVGRPITRVAVVLEGNIWDDVVAPAVTTVKPGEALTPLVARRALDELLGSGRFARGRVSASVDNGGALLTVRVVPRKQIGRLEVDLHGARVDVDEVLRAADLAEGGELVGAEVEDIAARIRRVLALHGYPSAIVDVQTRVTDDPSRALVLVDGKPGTPRHIDERRFYVFGADPAKVMPLTGAYGVDVHDRADEPTMEMADATLEQALRHGGWSRADVSHDLVWVGEPGEVGRIVLRVRIDAGPQQVPRFEGNEHYDADALTGALGLETETDRSPPHLAEKLRAFYQKRGFLDVEVRPETRGSEKDAVQLVVFHIDEHARARVVARRYPCLKLEAIRKLSAGGPRSPAEIGTEIDSFLEEELPGADLLVGPDPRGVSATIGEGAGQIATGARPEPIDLHPDATYVADTYDRAVQHVQELYRNEGFLHARVGPVQVVRARCDPRSPPQRCIPVPLPPLPTQLCTYDATGVPLPTEPLDAAFTCRPDPDHGVECAPTIQLVIPVKLGPRTTLWDVGFAGVKNASEQDVADAANLPLGEPVSTAKLDDARRRIVDWYKELGYAYVDVKYTLEPSPDNTRARVRFDVIEGDQVIVRSVVIRGLGETRESVVRRRLAIQVGQPYRTSDVRRTQEWLATLGVFSSINVGLSDPYVPAPNKTVVIDLVERVPQYVELRPGFSTGEGIRGTIEYGHRNLLGYAWAITVHLQASYLPNFLIVDPAVYANYNNKQHPLSFADRIATRDTVTMAWPEMGLGPTVRAQLDGIYVRDLERDFTLFKGAGVGTLIWRPRRELQIAGGASYEKNDISLFNESTIEQYLTEAANQGNADLARLLRVPDGDSQVYAQRVVLTWDRRDNAFNAHRGTYLAAGVEHADSFPVTGTAPAKLQFEGHILRLTQTLAGYVPITRDISFAAELRLGEVVNVSPCRPLDTTLTAPTYCTYPDRLFFMGGFDSMRGWLQDAFIPQEYADQIAAGKVSCTDQSNCQVPLRGGNLMINPRFELRFPIKSPVDGALFGDLGNLWNDPNYVFSRDGETGRMHGISLRADVGAGLRIQTPVGPLVFDYGVNVTRRSYEDLGAFHFAIGLF